MTIIIIVPINIRLSNLPNPDGSEDSKRVLGETEGGQPSNEDNDNEENQDNGDNGNNEDNNNGGSSSNDDGPLEELGRMLGAD